MKEIETDSSINLAALFFVFSLQLFALGPNKPLYHYQLDEWRLSHGIFHNWVSAIAQTPDGYLWIGTEDDGLKRLKDSTFKTLYQEAEIPGSRTSLYETGSKSIFSIRFDQRETYNM
jgi:ligand-binding sensor domain-containing protein